MEENFLVKSQEYISKSHYYRGKLIDVFGLLEREVGIHIFNHFENNNRSDFFNVVLDRLTFATKKEILKSIIDKHEVKAGFIKTKNNGYPNKKLFARIRECQEQRNYFAHYVLLIHPDKFDYAIGLGEFRDSPKSYWYTKDDFENWTLEISKCCMDLSNLMKRFNRDVANK